jgi:asparagine synthase (glutamine-hydrolysing)
VCGICGLWSLDGGAAPRALLHAMNALLSPRGPDGEGVFLDGALGLGHRRLAILDVGPEGRQPMSYADGRYWITYNGEIYNFLELRAELEARGHRFASAADTEVVLAAYAQWGEACQLRFNGMWAFAVWDRREGTLFLSRDRFGVKPLHYAFDGRRFAFASEMKAFLPLPWVDVSFDPLVVARALATPGLVEGTEACLLGGVRRLLGGHSLRVDRGGRVSTTRWWNTLDHLEAPSPGYAGHVERFRELFLDACRLRMRSDVPIGTSLSGGLDSSSVVCAVARAGRDPGRRDRMAADWQRAFVAVYPATPQDERAHAEAVAAHAGVTPVYVPVDGGDVVDHLEELVFQYEELSGVHVGPWLVYREMRRRGVVVTLDGHGGDELLGGYHHHLEALLRACLAFPPAVADYRRYRAILASMCPAGSAARPPRLGELVRERLRELLRAAPGLHGRARAFSRALRGRRGGGEAGRTPGARHPAAPAQPVFAILEEDAERLRGKDALFRELYRDFHCLNLPTNLRDYDRLSMAHGVEVRSPFLDWRLVCHAFSLPAASKVGGGFTKRVLRDAMRGLLPEAILNRKDKIGFANPLREWMHGPLRAYVADAVRSREFRESGLWDGAAIARDVEEAGPGREGLALAAALAYVQALVLVRSFSGRAARERAAPPSAGPDADGQPKTFFSSPASG